MTFHKRKWTLQRLQRAAARESRRQLRKEGVSVDSSHRRTLPQSGLDNFFQKQARSILESTWEVVQVSRLHVYIILTTLKRKLFESQLPRLLCIVLYCKTFRLFLLNTARVLQLTVYKLASFFFISERGEERNRAGIVLVEQLGYGVFFSLEININV